MLREALVTKDAVVFVASEAQRVDGRAFPSVIGSYVTAREEVWKGRAVRAVGTTSAANCRRVAVVAIDAGDDAARRQEKAGYIGVNAGAEYRMERGVAGIKLERNVGLIMDSRCWRRCLSRAVGMTPKAELIDLCNRLDFTESERIDPAYSVERAGQIPVVHRADSMRIVAVDAFDMSGLHNGGLHVGTGIVHASRQRYRMTGRLVELRGYVGVGDGAVVALQARGLFDIFQ